MHFSKKGWEITCKNTSIFNDNGYKYRSWQSVGKILGYRKGYILDKLQDTVLKTMNHGVQTQVCIPKNKYFERQRV
jgi:hypothetical protein